MCKTTSIHALLLRLLGVMVLGGGLCFLLTKMKRLDSLKR